MIIFIPILCLAVVGNDLLRTWEARSRTIVQSRREVENLTWSASQHADGAFQLVNTILADLAERVEVDDIGPAQLERLRHQMVQRVANSTLLEDLVLTDANGITIVDGRPKTPQINLSDREYFQFHRSHSDDDPRVGTVVRSRLTGRKIIPVSRRIDHTDGSFAGIVIATVEAQYFKAFYATFSLGNDGAAALWLTSGTLLVRQSLVSPPDNDPQSKPAGPYFFPEPVAGCYELISPFDGITRILSYRRIKDFPLVVAMALSKSEKLADWRQDAIEHLLAAISVTFLLGFIGIRLVLNTDRTNAIAIAKRNVELAASESDLRLLAGDLKVSEARYRFIADSTNDVIICAKLDAQRTYVSPACRTVFGYEPEEMFTDGTAPVHPDDAKAVSEAVNLLVQGAARQTLVTYRSQHKQGHWIWIEATISLIRDQDLQRPTSFVSSLRDISERHMHADELKRSNAALEQFAYAASHDLQAPLRAIAHLAQWIDEDVRDMATPDTLENLKLLSGRVARMQLLISGLLAYARIGHTAQEAEDIDCTAAVQDVVALLDPRPNFVVSCETEITTIRTYRTPFNLVLKNLITNALQHHDRAEGRVTVSMRMLDSYLEVTVSDDGPGIEEQFHEQIFVIFKTLKPRDEMEAGGLGLAMVKKQVIENGGQIWVNSAPPARGATFVFTWKLTAVK